MYLNDAIDQYLRLLKPDVAASTLRGATDELNRLLAHVGNLRLDRLNVDHMEDYFHGDNGRSSQVSPATFNNARAKVKAFTDWLRDEGYVKQDLMRRIKRQKMYSRERNRLTPEQMVAAIEACTHPRDKVLVAIAANTGMRVSSISGLRVGNVDLAEGVIQYRNVKSRRDRTLPITADLDRSLREWFTWYQECCGPLQPDWYLVPARPRGGWYTHVLPDRPAGSPTRSVHAALAAIGADGKGEGFHTFRRSAATAVYQKAIDAGDPRAIHIAQAFCDHENAATTQIYLGRNHEQESLRAMLKGQVLLATDKTSAENVVTVDFAGRRRSNA